MTDYLSFTTLKKKDSASLLDHINAMTDYADFDVGKVSIMAADLPFYEGYQLFEVKDQTYHPPREIKGIWKPDSDDVRIFTYEPKYFYELNTDIDLALNEETIIDYTRFFFEYTEGLHGKLIIIETIDDMPWRDDISSEMKKSLAKHIHPVDISFIGDEKFLLNAIILYKNALIETEITVLRSGRVTFDVVSAIADDLPVIDDISDI